MRAEEAAPSCSPPGSLPPMSKEGSERRSSPRQHKHKLPLTKSKPSLNATCSSRAPSQLVQTSESDPCPLTS